MWSLATCSTCCLKIMSLDKIMFRGDLMQTKYPTHITHHTYNSYFHTQWNRTQSTWTAHTQETVLQTTECHNPGAQWSIYKNLHIQEKIISNPPPGPQTLKRQWFPCWDIQRLIHIDGVVQDRCNFIANALEILQSCTYLSIYPGYLTKCENAAGSPDDINRQESEWSYVSNMGCSHADGQRISRRTYSKIDHQCNLALSSLYGNTQGVIWPPEWDHPNETCHH